MNKPTKPGLAGSVYESVKADLFDFRLMPGERFSENDISTRLGVSRTPVREALTRLAHEGYIQVASKSGWSVRPFDFEYFEELYDLRIVLELAAVRRLCDADPLPDLAALKEVWLVPPAERLDDAREVGRLDELFHLSLVAATGNREMSRVFRDITERIRIVRRLEFGFPERIKQTYLEHGQILRAILRRKPDEAALLLRSHVETAKAEVRRITLHKLALARRQGDDPTRRAAI